ncbi:hypothetical protein QUB80_20990 [Chlorogloeopsis sp. ULAP01]|uniref:hypothetical protein n=1 Tax=Chlorogloeopsis sp. ULAP01 TaxID=3056483 RepID=UPI0025AAAE78|nr:hypothetical protein [Chlorogloeopsis sp. ULAP01]MDM9383174.1 hypothetical protein [Chlorogloeopsis sp. ULAP01]
MKSLIPSATPDAKTRLTRRQVTPVATTRLTRATRWLLYAGEPVHRTGSARAQWLLCHLPSTYATL